MGRAERSKTESIASFLTKSSVDPNPKYIFLSKTTQLI